MLKTNTKLHWLATFRDAGTRLRNATLEGAAEGFRTFDLGGDSTTSGVVDDVFGRLRASI